MPVAAPSENPVREERVSGRRVQPQNETDVVRIGPRAALFTDGHFGSVDEALPRLESDVWHRVVGLSAHAVQLRVGLGDVGECLFPGVVALPA